jgi:hypothetical protein
MFIAKLKDGTTVSFPEEDLERFFDQDGDNLQPQTKILKARRLPINPPTQT